jgi:hypothetical protein
MEMRNKQILIEKYIEPSEIITQDTYVIKLWFNEDGDLHSFMGQPGKSLYFNKKIIKQVWYKKNKIHRDKNLPAVIFYRKEQVDEKRGYKNGVLIDIKTA